MKTEPIPDYADVMPIAAWKEAVACGAFIPEDGSGYLCLDDKTMVLKSNVWVKMLPPWATHVAWFNK